MAFRATGDIKADAYIESKRIARQMKTYVQGVRNATAAGSVSSNLIVELHTRLVADRNRLDAIRSVPGIGSYAQDQENDPGYDVVAEFMTMVAELSGAIDWIIANFPSAGGFIQKDTLTTSGVTVRQFTSAQTAGLRTELDSLLAAIA